MELNIGITGSNLKESIGNLTKVLSNEMILYVKSRKFHWNVSGNSFMEIHKLFENQYSAIEKTVDAVAERISTLGGKAIGTMKEFLTYSSLGETTTFPTQSKMIQDLLNDYEIVIRDLRQIIKAMESNNDFGTIDFLTGLMQSHESKAWVLRKYLA